MTTPAGRKALHAFLDEETAADLTALCRRHGPTKSSLVEACARVLIDADDTDAETIPTERIWQVARDVDADRRARGGGA
jgi:hypothetical protein